MRHDWDNANLEHYRDTIHSALNEVDIPSSLFGCCHDCDNDAHRLAIDITHLFHVYRTVPRLVFLLLTLVTGYLMYRVRLASYSRSMMKI